LYEEGNVWDIVKKVFRENPQLRNVQSAEVLEQLGLGNTRLETLLQEQLLELLEPDELGEDEQSQQLQQQGHLAARSEDKDNSGESREDAISFFVLIMASLGRW
jgi:hypothetical protein